MRTISGLLLAVVLVSVGFTFFMVGHWAFGLGLLVATAFIKTEETE